MLAESQQPACQLVNQELPLRHFGSMLSSWAMLLLMQSLISCVQ